MWQSSQTLWRVPVRTPLVARKPGRVMPVSRDIGLVGNVVIFLDALSLASSELMAMRA